MNISVSNLFSSETKEKDKGLFQLQSGDCKALKPPKHSSSRWKE